MTPLRNEGYANYEMIVNNDSPINGTIIMCKRGKCMDVVRAASISNTFHIMIAVKLFVFDLI